MKPTDLAIRLTAFLSEYLPRQRNLSPNTIRAYRDVFVLLLRYCKDSRKLPPERLTLGRLDASLVIAFLEHLESERGNSVSTRNQRLAAVHAFFRYLQVEDPERMLQCQRILAIPVRRCPRPVVNYLPKGNVGRILAQPDLRTVRGRRDAVLLSVLYDTAARVQELIDVSVRDVRLESPAQIRLTGKGRKPRVVPLLTNTVALLSEYMSEHSLLDPEQATLPLFPGRWNRRLTRSGVRYILRKYADRARATDATVPENISPHTMRHSKAMHLLQAGVPLPAIRDLLGHADVKTSDTYARHDAEAKRRALEKASGQTPTPGLPSWQANNDLMAFLRTL